jgi:hypothetical protein
MSRWRRFSLFSSFISDYESSLPNGDRASLASRVAKLVKSDKLRMEMRNFMPVFENY